MTLPSGNVAVLSKRRRWRFTVFLMVYAAQGIPFGLIFIALPAYMANQGVDALTISAFLGGLFSMVFGGSILNFLGRTQTAFFASCKLALDPAR